MWFTTQDTRSRRRGRTRWECFSCEPQNAAGHAKGKGAVETSFLLPSVLNCPVLLYACRKAPPQTQSGQGHTEVKGTGGGSQSAGMLCKGCGVQAGVVHKPVTYTNKHVPNGTIIINTQRKVGNVQMPALSHGKAVLRHKHVVRG